jgi:hypothetical protein
MRTTKMVISAVVAVAILAGVALPAFAQEAQGQAYCDWYWGYQFNPAGGYEYWCWDPHFGWWYSTDAKSKTQNVTIT